MNEGNAKLIVLSSFEENLLETGAWDDDVKSQTKFSVLNSSNLNNTCYKLSISGKYPGIFSEEAIPPISSYEKVETQYANLGYLLLANNPYPNLNSISPFAQAIAISFKKYKNKKHDVEVVSYKYFQWMKAQGASWTTTCMDIVGALPRFNWVSVNADILESISIEDFKKTLEILIQDRTIVGFDIHNVTMSDAFKLCEALATSLLISQGRISKDRYLRTPFAGLPEKPSGLLPVQNLTL